MPRHWIPEPVFAGASVAVLGNGPSLSMSDVIDLDPRYVIAVNSAIRLCPNAHVLFSRDYRWCAKYPALIDSAWSSLKVTSSREAARERGMLLVRMERRDSFAAVGHPAIRYGVSSGHAAVSLAIAMGAKEIELHGFDGRVVQDRSHWHADYEEPRREVYTTFVRGWHGWNAAALARGCRIVNSTPGSAITEFPFLEMVEAA
jgi:hypothetical protein